MHKSLILLASTAALGLAQAVGAANPPSPAAAVAAMAPADAATVRSALAALPAGLRNGATVVAMDGKGGMRTLKQGSNGFTCMPDDPNTPGADPMCADKASMDFLHALMGKTAPPKGKVGLMYMLAGGSDTSNTDPYAAKPADGKWITTGPHLMIAGTDQAFLDQYPKGASPDTGAPYVMWAGTPYAHLMVPVK